MLFRKTIASTRFFTALWKPIQIFKFSQQAQNPGSNKIEFQDWEYCRLISLQLKQNKVNQALSYLFKSYFNGKVLDIQIYNSIFQKINELKLQLSYSEVLYQIYRQHFPAHMLMSKWMSKLIHTKNNKLLDIIYQDYAAINEPIPIRVVKNVKKEMKEENEEQKTQSAQSSERIRSKRGRKRKDLIKNSEQNNEIELPKLQMNQNDQVIKAKIQNNQSRNLNNNPKDISKSIEEELMKIKSANQIKEVMENLNLELGTYQKIILKDVEIIMSNQQDSQQMEQNEDSHDQSYQYPNDQHNQNSEDLQDSNLGLFGLQISKIKIGKIEFYKDKNNQDDQ